MKSIMATYSGFQALPRGIKRLLLTSENYFFNDATSFTAAKSAGPASAARQPWQPENSARPGGQPPGSGTSSWNQKPLELA
jgi:hypothetical protein